MTSRSIPYSRQIVDEHDIAAVVEVLRSDWLTTGPAVVAFERAFAELVGAEYAVACSSGTAALHLAMLAAGIGPGDEVIVSALTFAASANCVRYVGAEVVFADVREDTLTIDPSSVAALVTERTRAIVCVDYAGIPCDLDELMTIAARHDLLLIEDACHALGATYRERKVGSIAHMSIFSFHPVKHITTGEGGMVTTNDPNLARNARRYRNHGIDSEFRDREAAGTWEYDMMFLGYNYRLSDINCALGMSQIGKLDRWVQDRRRLAARYQQHLSDATHIRTPEEPSDRQSSWHLYRIRIVDEKPAELRRRLFEQMRGKNIGVNVHYRPVYLHSYYRERGYRPGLCPVAEAAYEALLSLPMWPGLTTSEQNRVIKELTSVSGPAG